MKQTSPLLNVLISLVLLFASGCGGSSDEFATYTPPNNVQQPTGTLRVEQVLERAVPQEVVTFRFTGFGASGEVLYGPVIEEKAARIDLEGVPTSVKSLQTEYLDGQGNLRGIGRVAVEIKPGEVTVITAPPFKDLATELTLLAVSPDAASIAAGTDQQFRAIGRFSDSSQQDLTSVVEWRSSDEEIAGVDELGIATGKASGTAEIIAELSGVEGSATLTVTDAAVTSITVTPDSPALGANLNQEFTARATFSDGTSQPVTTSSEWTSLDTDVATIDPETGVATGVSTGQTVISANFRGVVGTTTLTVLEELGPPQAHDDDYEAFGNVRLYISPRNGVLGNDVLNNAAVTEYDTESANGGTVELTGEGDFFYDPPVGFTGQDSFTYTLASAQGTDQATVTISVEGRYWFVNNAAVDGDGTMTRPFSTLAEAVDASSEGDVLFVFRGDGTSAGLTGPVTLKQDQELRGEATGLSIPGDLVLVTGPADRPELVGPITLADGNRVNGVSVTASDGAAGLQGSGVGDIVLDDIRIQTNGEFGGLAVNLNGSLTLSNSVIVGNAPFNGIFTSGASAGTFIGDNNDVSGNFDIISEGESTLSVVLTRPGGNSVWISAREASSLTAEVNEGRAADIHFLAAENAVLSVTAQDGVFSSLGFSSNDDSRVEVSLRDLSTGYLDAYTQSLVPGGSPELSLNGERLLGSGDYSGAYFTRYAGFLTVKLRDSSFSSFSAQAHAYDEIGNLCLSLTDNVLGSPGFPVQFFNSSGTFQVENLNELETTAGNTFPGGHNIQGIVVEGTCP